MIFILWKWYDLNLDILSFPLWMWPTKNLEHIVHAEFNMEKERKNYFCPCFGIQNESTEFVILDLKGPSQDKLQTKLWFQVIVSGKRNLPWFILIDILKKFQTENWVSCVKHLYYYAIYQSKKCFALGVKPFIKIRLDQRFLSRCESSPYFGWRSIWHLQPTIKIEVKQQQQQQHDLHTIFIICFLFVLLKWHYFFIATIYFWAKHIHKETEIFCAPLLVFFQKKICERK